MLMKKLSWLLILGFIAYACQTEDVVSDQQELTTASRFKVSSSDEARNGRSATDVCGDVKPVTLWAGQHINVGTLEVYNNEESLFVVYTTSGDWKITETHLYVGTNPPKNKAGILVPGHFPYSATHNNATSVVYEIPLADLEDCFQVYAHAVVKKIVNGQVVSSQTAFGGDTAGTGPRWFFYTDYCVQDCEDEECVPTEEVAWSEGELYDGQSGWATFTPYIEEGSTVTLYAGQTLVAGTVTFSVAWFDPETSVGYVTLTIELNDCWNFSTVSQNVKIQDYESIPSGTPSPELFDTQGDATGSTFSIVVPYSRYYGVHVDLVGGCCE